MHTDSSIMCHDDAQLLATSPSSRYRRSQQALPPTRPIRHSALIFLQRLSFRQARRRRSRRRHHEQLSHRPRSFRFGCFAALLVCRPLAHFRSSQFLIFLVHHLWCYDRFKCLRWTAGRQPGAFKRVMTVRPLFPTVFSPPLIPIPLSTPIYVQCLCLRSTA